MGVVLYELLCGVRPFGHSPFEVHAAIVGDSSDVDVSPLELAGASDAAMSFVAWLLTKEFALRPTAQDVLDDMRWPIDDKDAEYVRPASVMKQRSMVTGMEQFEERSTFGKAVLLCVASQLDAAKLESLNNLFERLDTDGSGKLSVQEITDGLSDLGLESSQLDNLVDSIDVDHSGTVEYSEFIAGALDARKELVESTLFHAFNAFDINHDGKIAKDELAAVLNMGGDFATFLPDGKTLDDVLRDVDVSKDGFISYEEFYGYLQKEAGPVKRSRSLRESVSRKSISKSVGHDDGGAPSPSTSKQGASTAIKSELSLTMPKRTELVPGTVHTNGDSLVAQLGRCVQLSARNVQLLEGLVKCRRDDSNESADVSV